MKCMNLMLRLFCGDSFADIPLGKKTTIGSGLKNTFTIDDKRIKKRAVKAVRKKNKVVAYFHDKIDYDGFKIKKIELKADQTFVISKECQTAIMVIEQSDDNKEQSIKLDAVREISIGRDKKNNVVFSNRRVSGSHAKIYRLYSEYHIADTKSTNGTYLNGKRVEDEILKNEDEIVIGKYTIVFNGDEIKFKNCGKELLIHNIQRCDRELTERPVFKRSPRLEPEIPSKEIEIQAAPSIGGKPEINWFSVLVPAFGMVGVMFLAAVLTGGSMSTLIYTGPMSLIGVIVSINSYSSQKKRHRQQVALRKEKYRQYIDDTINEIEENTEAQRKALTLSDPETNVCFDIARDIDRRLWERKPTDKDFASYRIGSGEAEASIKIKIPNTGLVLESDEFTLLPEQIYDKYKIVKDIPIVYNSAEYPTCGLIGERKSELAAVKNIVAQAAVHYSYDEFKIVVIFSEKESVDFAWMRWLPHTFNDDKSMRFMADTKQSANVVLNYFEDIFKQRDRENRDEKNYRTKSVKLPFYLFVIANANFVDGHPMMEWLTRNDPDLGTAVIFIDDEMSFLPKDCQEIIEVKNGRGSIYNKKNTSQKTEFTIDDMSKYDFEKFARNLAPITMPTTKAEANLPNCITFLEGCGVKTPDQIPIKKCWSEGETYKSMAVPIGVKANGEKFMFDIHEKKHGPHGLVAGTTGSGKSEMVQSWILSMALNFSPLDVSFVLIDFKGTGLILPFLDLPHLAGTISDLDKNIKRNLIALENELSRRKAMLDDAGVSNINAYLKKLHVEKSVSEPMPYLFIIIDEFAEFKAQFPDFGAVIDSILRTGRTLGVFSVLLMQKPAGVVSDQSESNVKFRWCLKVASPADSREMIRTGDAAQIANAGRAYVKVSNEGAQDYVYELIQSFWSGAPYDPNRKEKATVKPRISAVDILGRRIAYDVAEKTTSFKADVNEIDVIVKQLKNTAIEAGNLKAKKIWDAKLASVIPLDDINEALFDGEKWEKSEYKNCLNPVVGMADDPRSQKQYPFEVNFSEDGHTIIYGAPGTGKTTFLQTLIMSLCMSFRPDEVSIYIMDFGGWNMGLFRDFPHVGGVANDNEAEKVTKSVRLIQKELDARKHKFAEEGVGNIRAYREASGDNIPFIVLILDNFAPVLNLYPELDEFFISLTREGGNYGVYFVTTVTNAMGVNYKIAQNIKKGIALQMADKSDYSTIVGRTEGLEPEKNPGRGLIKAESVLEIQTALPIKGTSESDRAFKIKERGKKMDLAWKGKRAKPIPLMPETVYFGSVKSENIVLGLSSQDIEPVEISFDQSHCILISGKPRSGKSNLIKVILNQMKAEQMLIFDPEAALKSLKAKNVEYCADAEAFDGAIAGLIPELERRRKIHQENESANFESTAVVIDDLNRCFEGASNDTMKRLSAIAKIGKGLNVFLIAAGAYDELSKLCNQGEQLTGLMAAGYQSVILGGCANDHDMFRISNLNYTEKNAALEENEGYLIVREKAVRFKSMYEKEEVK